MRPLPRRWHDETWICSLRGHVTPAAAVRTLRPEDDHLGVAFPDGTRAVRCLRCDLWLRVPDPGADAESDTLPPVDQLTLPLRGQALRQRLVLRLIAVERGAHVALFGLVGLAALVARFELGFLQRWAQDLLGDLQAAVGHSARAASHTSLQTWLSDLADLAPGTLLTVIVVSFAYAAIEGLEAVGLWRGRRWAEYLTVVVTASLLPVELRELAEGVSPFRVAALALNLVIVVYLVWAKRLFGIRGGAAAAEAHTDWQAVLASPLTAGAATRTDDDLSQLMEDRRPRPPREGND